MKKQLLLCTLLSVCLLSMSAQTTVEKCEIYGDGNITKAANAHEYVDLCLPSGTRWATCNVGADSPEEYGSYFAWGETTGYGSDIGDSCSLNWANYKWCSGSSTTMTKYCTDSCYGTADNKTELEIIDDAAYINWGGDWRLPSYDQQTELRTNCTWTWTQKNGVNGYEVKGTNGNSIFLPAAGCRYDNWLIAAASGGYYWSRSLYAPSSSYAYSLDFDSSTVIWGNCCRNYWLSVRPVRASDKSAVSHDFLTP